eukprot:scaffold24918_cov142-Cylindrotheca_fusiformis.AAC.3
MADLVAGSGENPCTANQRKIQTERALENFHLILSGNLNKICCHASKIDPYVWSGKLTLSGPKNRKGRSNDTYNKLENKVSNIKELNDMNRQSHPKRKYCPIH